MLQLFTGPLLIGYVWSWYWAYLIVMKTFNPHAMKQNQNMAASGRLAANPVSYDNDPGFMNNR